MERIEEDAEQVLRMASVAVELPELTRELIERGWAVNLSPAGKPERQMFAAKGAGRVHCPGGRRGQWDPVVRRVRQGDWEPALGVPTELDEVTEWGVRCSLATPLHVLVSLAELAADDPDDLRMAS